MGFEEQSEDEITKVQLDARAKDYQRTFHPDKRKQNGMYMLTLTFLIIYAKQLVTHMKAVANGLPGQYRQDASPRRVLPFPSKSVCQLKFA